MPEMNAADWEKHMLQESGSFESYWKKRNTPTVTKKNKKGDELKSIDFLAIKRKSLRATFFLTNEGIAGNFGFWCPNKCIDSIKGKKVIVESWFSIKVIKYPEY
tara:strand:+ start:107 stop:418 length:312 start_codon:yes stop_codon:yes gene_type:complete